jgi:hypothetical protein
MKNRYAHLRKKLIKESATLVCLVSFFAVLGVVLHNYSESVQSEQHIQENEVNAFRVKLAELRRFMESGQEQVALYNTFIKNHGQDLTLDRESASQFITAQHEKYHLVNLSITIPPFSELPKETLSIKSGTMIKSDVKITFGALTDNSVFAFIEKLQREMPGMVVLKEVRIIRTTGLTSDVIVGINKHRITPVVTADLSFAWIGIRNDIKGSNNAK